MVRVTLRFDVVQNATSDLCKGPSSQGTFGECCDTDAQCGPDLFCDPAQRACTLKCTEESDCNVAPLYGGRSCGIISGMTCEVADLAYPYLWGVYNGMGSGGESTSAPSPPPQRVCGLHAPVHAYLIHHGYMCPPPSSSLLLTYARWFPPAQFCDASVAYGWSFAPYCSTCRSGNWSGDAAPPVPYSDEQRVATLLATLLEDLCSSSPALSQRCGNSTVLLVLNDFLEKVGALYSTSFSISPILGVLCSNFVSRGTRPAQ